MSQYTVLMFIEDLHVCRRLGWYLEYKGCQVLRAPTGKALEKAVNSQEFDLILAQINREDLEGLNILQEAKRFHPWARLILVNAAKDMTFPWQAYRLEVDDYLFLDCRPAELWRRVSACLERLPERRKNAGAVSRSRPLNRAVARKVQQISQYFSYTLDSSKSILQSLINSSEAGLDRKWLPKIQEVSARLEVLQEMMQGFNRGIAVPGKTGNLVRIR
ncbi:MAG: response regulator [Desulfobaccales bacterium]